MYELFFDGGVLPNPGGEASFGYVLKLNKKEIDKGYGIIGRGKYMTDITAEYYALSQGLSSFVRILSKSNAILKVFGDSTFVIKQVTHTGKARRDFPELKIIDYKIQQIKDLGIDVQISWIPREQNKECDDLVKLFRSRSIK